MTTPAAGVLMPDLVTTYYGARHTVDSAIPTLLKLGVDVDRIVLASAGPGWPRGTVVAQRPARGTPLSPESRVTLEIAGSGMMERIPFPMRDSQEGAFRIDRLVALFDDHFLKLGHYLRSAGGLLDLHPDDRAGSARWISEIFQLDHRHWAEERWYDVARLLPALHRIAGTPLGPALALMAVFRVPASPVRLVPGIAPVAEARRTRLGTLNGRLGVDALIGDGIVANTAVEIDLGPVDLPTYWFHRKPGIARERRALYQLVLPAHLRHEIRERWVVGNRDEGAVLGDARRAAALGVNSYLGDAAEARSAA